MFIKAGIHKILGVIKAMSKFQQLFLVTVADQIPLALCLLGNFSCFCLFLLTFFKIIFLEKYFGNTIRLLNGLDPDLIRTDSLSVLICCRNCLQRLSVDDKSRC